jgi:16S rRNA G1207 methylase RsmC
MIDVGGGIGAVSLALLKEFPQLKSIVQERPEAVTNGRNVSSAPAIKR